MRKEQSGKSLEEQNRLTVAVCLECGDEIRYGRSDKKFCCDACKNRYHNRQAHDSRQFRQMVHSILDRNYLILDSLRRTTLKNIPLSDLVKMGFRKECFTSYRKSSRCEIFMCYDIRYFVSGDSVTTIFRVQAMDMEEALP